MNIDMHLGAGSRVQHARMGQGVVIANKYDTYLITFLDEGTHEIAKDDPMLETLHAENVNPEVETISDVEKSLLGILRQWAGVQEIVPLGENGREGYWKLSLRIIPLSQRKFQLISFFIK